MTENVEEIKRPYYWASEIPTLIGPTTPSLSSFYRYAASGKIHKVDNQGQTDTAYSGEDVRQFLRGELSRKKGGISRGKLSSRLSKAHTVSSISAPKPIIDYVRERSDLAHIFLMESELLGEASLLPNTQLSWVKKNEYAYWFLSNPDAKDDVWATLAMLPMREDKIFTLLRGEIALQDVTSDDILTYSSEHLPLSCYTSAIVRAEHGDALIKLLQSVFAFWCEKASDVQIDKLYVSVPRGVEETPLHKMVKEFYFSPLYQFNGLSQMAWELDFNFYNPSIEIQKLQKCLSKEFSHEEKGENPVIAIMPETRSIIDNRSGEREAKKRLARMNNKSGFIRSVAAASGILSKDVHYRRVESDDDIRAVLEINASHFGKSTRPEEDLIRTRRYWIEHNPEVFHVLEISTEKLLRDGVYSPEELEGVDKKIVGFLSMLPVSPDNIDRLVRGDLVVSQVKGEDILPYLPCIPVDLFVQTLAIHKILYSRSESTFREYGKLLLKGVMGMFHAYGENGIEIRTIHARSDTSFGQHTSQGLGFELVPPPPGVHKDVFLLDIAQSDRPFLVDYVATLQHYKEEHGLASAAS